MNDPYQLILAKKFNKAIIEYTKRIETKPSYFLYGNRAIAYINIGELEKALDDYQKAEYYSNQEIYGKTDAYMKDIGMILWLMGRELEAAELWNKAVQEHIAGKIEYSDMAGGVESGALLWFASSRHNLNHYREIAIKYLTKKSKSSRIKHWPGPIAQYILGKLSDESLVTEVYQVNGKIRDRYFCQAYFYMGIKALQENRLDDYQKLLAKSVEAGESSLIENEYYLAKHELELYSKRVS